MVSRPSNVYHFAWIILLYFIYFVINYSEAVNHKQDEYLKTLESYDITIPSRVTREGDHVSYLLHPGHVVRRRSTDFSHLADDDTFHYKVQVDNKDLILKLKPNYKLTSPSFVIERKKNKFKNITDSVFQKLDNSYSSCHFQGEIVNQTESSVAVALCNGLHGFIHTNSIQYFIEPLQLNPITPEGHHRHVIYRRSALPLHLDPVIASHVHKRSTNEDESCGVKDTSQAFSQRDRWEQHHRVRRKAPRRMKRSVSTEKYVETLVVVDPKMVEYHASEILETYVLTIMNMVATMFHDATVGNSINIVLVRILIMEEPDDELEITHHADNTLKSFCKFQKEINPKDDDHPNHHDVAILLTRHNICSRVNEPCSTLGLAQVAGMCQPHRSCNINEDTGLALAYTVTHELGHNFGMHHDGYNNGCTDPPGKQLYIMSPSLVADSLRKSWSNCSKASITKFIDRDWGYCLDDEPGEHPYSFPVLPAGTMYDANHQCRLQYGTDDTEICADEEDVCTNLWCRINNRCSTHLEAAAEGTICGENKWCYEGKCVKIGERPESINGEWGQWSSWTDCTRTCGAGVTHSQRHCDNPEPSHGGKYCLGERKRYRICNTEDCPENSPSFNQVQCEEFNYIPYKNGLYEWEHVPTTESPCQLHCKPTSQFFSVLLKDIVTDGTPCTAGTRNMCISGRCRHIGCDYVIDSKAIEDRCGVCHGDGSTCRTVKSKYTETQGLGYVQAAVIPTGARNIRVEEIAEANNFLALQNNNGEYYLNGHWFIQWSGDYKIAGTTVHYEREGNMESVTAQGPLKEPLHVMLLLQSENPGVTFEYTVPKENVSESRVPEFSWSYLPWTHCTSSCGGGTQRSEVACTEIEAGIVEDKYCHGMPKPDDKQKVCNEHLCPARWWFGPWQHCSVSCGDSGVHHRTVICVRSLGPDEQIALDDEACSDQEKPKEIEPCHKKEPCAGTSPWIVGEWSDCDGNPCGLKFRSVTCKDPEIGCEKNEIPVSELPCSNVTCGQWVTENWVECTRSCDNGIQYRKVVCEGGHQCDPHKEPPSERNCNLGPCPTQPPVSSPSTETHEETPVADTEMHSATVNKETSTVSHSVSSEQTMPKTRNTTKEENEETKSNTDAKVIEEKDEHEDLIIHPTEGGLDEIDKEKTVESTVVKPTTSEEIRTTTTEDTSNEKFDIKSDDNSELDEEKDDESDIIHNKSENKTVRHKHRHHHGEYSDVSEETLVQERKPDNENVFTQEKVSSGKVETQEQQSGEVDFDFEKSNNLTSIISLDLYNSSHAEQSELLDVDLPGLDTDKGEKPDTENSTEISDTGTETLPKLPDMKELTKLSKMPPLPDMNNLPPLPDIDKLPPLPKQEITPKLPPLLNKEIPALPDLSQLPPLPDKHSHLPLLSDIDKLPRVPDEDLPHISGKEELGSFPGKNAETKNLANLFTTENTHVDLPQTNTANLPPLNSLPSLPNPNNLQSLLDKTLPALPDKDTLAPLQDLDTAPSLYDEDLSPLQHTDGSDPFPDYDEILEENDKDLPSVPHKEVLSPLPDDYTLSSLPDKNMPPLPDKDLPPLPDKDKLAPLPDIGDLPPLPNLPRLPNMENLPPLPERDTDSEKENTGATLKETSNDVFIQKANTGIEKDDSIGNRVKLGDSDTSIIFSEENLANEGNISDSADSDKDGNYTWMTSNWTECTRYCGGGVKTRSVHCINTETEEIVEEINCDINYKLNPTAECNTQTCLDWVVSEWDMCSSSCGESVQTRIVYCPKELSCDPKSRPINTQTCDVPKCVKWVSGQWSRCTKTCDGGEQYRLIQCVNTETQQFAEGCDMDTKPKEKQDCNMDGCPEQKAAALTVGCEHNEMSSDVCRALKRMQQCNNRFVAVKCCKTCGSKPNKHRPKEIALR